MREFVLDENLSESTFVHSLAMDGTVDDLPATSETGAVYWRWLDEPSMELQFLGEGKVGSRLSVPFANPELRAIEFFTVGLTQHRNRSVQQVKQGRRTVYYPAQVPILVSATFSDPNVNLVLTGNGGEGSIYVQRKIDSGDFALIATLAYNATSYSDTPAIDGDYTYKLTQAGVAGESNSITVAVDISTPGSGSPPSGLSGTFDGVDNIALTWTNNGGTGSNVVERRIGSGIWQTVATLGSSSTSHDQLTIPDIGPQLHYFRVRNTSVAGYSNEITVYVPKET